MNKKTTNIFFRYLIADADRRTEAMKAGAKVYAAEQAAL